MAIPTKDAALATWSAAFVTGLEPSPITYGISAQMLSQYQSLHDAYIAAYNAANADGQRSKAKTAAKRTAKQALLDYGRDLYKLVQGFPGLTPEQKIEIGVHVDDRIPTPQPPPGLAPILTVVRVSGYSVVGQLRDASVQGARRRPPNAAGALVLSHVGENHPPLGSPNWQLEAPVTQPTFNLTFASTLPPGTKVWLTAAWYSRRGELSPSCEPISTYLHGWGQAAA